MPPKRKRETYALQTTKKPKVSKVGVGVPLMAMGNYELWPHGVLVFRGAVDAALQPELLNDVMGKLRLRTDMLAVSGDKIAAPPPRLGFSFQTGWSMGGDGKATLKNDNDAPACLATATNLYNQARKCDVAELIDSYNAAQSCSALRLPDLFVARSLWARAYTPDQRLAFHQDPYDCHFAFIISLGRTVDFSFSRGSPDGLYAAIAYPTKDGDVSDCKLEQGRVHTVSLKSGDAIFFNGTILFHSITNIHGRETLPAWWTEQDFQRIGLQMRERHPYATS